MDLRAKFVKKLALKEEQALQEALTTARVTAKNALVMEGAEAQKAVEVGAQASGLRVGFA